MGRVWRFLFGAAAIGLLAAGEARAQPQVPATFFGRVTFADARAAGVDLRAFIGEVDCTQLGPGQRLLFDGDSANYVVHVLHESQRAGCGKPGVQVRFRVDGVEATGVGTWAAGPNELDLNVPSAGAGTPTPPNPSVATTPAATPSPSPAPPRSPESETTGSSGATPGATSSQVPPTATSAGVVAAVQPSPPQSLPTVDLGAAPRGDGSGRRWPLILPVAGSALLVAALAGWRIRKGSFRA